MCVRWELNPQSFRRQFLKLLRMPIPPLAHEARISVFPMVGERNSLRKENLFAVAVHSTPEGLQQGAFAHDKQVASPGFEPGLHG